MKDFPPSGETGKGATTKTKTKMLTKTKAQTT